MKSNHKKNHTKSIFSSLNLLIALLLLGASGSTLPGALSSRTLEPAATAAWPAGRGAASQAVRIPSRTAQRGYVTSRPSIQPTSRVQMPSGRSSSIIPARSMGTRDVSSRSMPLARSYSSSRKGRVPLDTGELNKILKNREPGKMLDLSNYDFKNIGNDDLPTDLTYIDFSNSNLRGKNFLERDVTGSNFTGADLTYAVFFEKHPWKILGGTFPNFYGYQDYFADTKGIKDAIWKNAMLDEKSLMPEIKGEIVDYAKYFNWPQRAADKFKEQVKDIINMHRYRDLFSMYWGGAKGLSWEIRKGLIQFYVLNRLNFNTFEKAYQELENMTKEIKKDLISKSAAEDKNIKSGDHKSNLKKEEPSQVDLLYAKPEQNRQKSAAELEAYTLLGISPDASYKTIDETYAAYVEGRIKGKPLDAATIEILEKAGQAYRVLVPEKVRDALKKNRAQKFEQKQITIKKDTKKSNTELEKELQARLLLGVGADATDADIDAAHKKFVDAHIGGLKGNDQEQKAARELLQQATKAHQFLKNKKNKEGL